jgi:hypothetical protein
LAKKRRQSVRLYGALIGTNAQSYMLAQLPQFRVA